ncbi:mCG147020 [Mus musculus]|nr:mCG147020 [Mus musculus]
MLCMCLHVCCSGAHMPQFTDGSQRTRLRASLCFLPSLRPPDVQCHIYQAIWSM